ncbi:MAG: hypothetical protein EBR82_49070, partial [Caulobacteraceae bacterium]|nr:hypothetical protein [Caulobacteraceae bacterium]
QRTGRIHARELPPLRRLLPIRSGPGWLEVETLHTDERVKSLANRHAFCFVRFVGQKEAGDEREQMRV